MSNTYEYSEKALNTNVKAAYRKGLLAGIAVAILCIDNNPDKVTSEIREKLHKIYDAVEDEKDGTED